jgi:hypothetical protein
VHRERRAQDRPLKRLRQLQSRLEAVLADSRVLRSVAERSNSPEVGHASAENKSRRDNPRTT